jgi:hypothetical protein
MMKVFVSLALLGPSLCMADTPLAGTWIVKPELTVFGDDHPLELMIDRGAYRRTGCGIPIEISADGTDQPVKSQPLFDTLSVHAVDSRRVGIVEKRVGKIVWKGLYTVSKDQRSMALEFDDERASKAVTGVMHYARQGSPLSGAHALSGSWRPEKLTQLSAGALTMTIQEEDHGLAVTWSDGRSAKSPLDAKYYPLNGYLSGAQISILHPRPDTLAMNREQGAVPVEVARAIVSEDGKTITYTQVDWICHGVASYIYQKQEGT